MAFFQYLVFDGENLPLPDSYEVELEDVEADSGGETEAGTTQRDVVRHGVVRIPVSFSVTAKWLKKLAGYAKLDKISVQYFDVETAELKLAEMYVTGYKAKPPAFSAPACARAGRSGQRQFPHQWRSSKTGWHTQGKRRSGLFPTGVPQRYCPQYCTATG